MTESNWTCPTIRELPDELRPITRMTYAGPTALSDSEALSIILGSGQKGTNAVRLAETVLVRFGGLAGIVPRAPCAGQTFPLLPALLHPLGA